MTQLVDFLIDGRILLDEGIRTRHVGFRLIVIVIGYKVFDGVVGKQFLEFTIQLRSQGLVVSQYQGWPLHLCHHVGHGEGFAGTGHAQQYLMGIPPPQAVHQFGNGLRLIPLRLISGFEYESGHAATLSRNARQKQDR